jgi:hypothetical protein
MSPPHPTFAKPKTWFQKQPSHHRHYISSAEPSWQMMWHGLKVELLSLTHRPSYQYLDMREEYRTSKSVASRPSDWLLLVLAMRPLGAPLTKTNGKIRE